MPIRDYGAVCDVSVLVDRRSIKRARSLLDGCGLYIPNSTYSWLARTKLIGVRGKTVSYSLLRRAINSREIYPIHLPDIYDEIARKLMFRVERKVPLTDFRAFLLSAHLQVPLLTFDDGLLSRLAEHIEIRTLWNFQGHGSWQVARDALEFYRGLLFSSGKRFYELIEGGKTFSQITEDASKSEGGDFEATREKVQSIDIKKSNPGILNFRYLMWNILPVIREYLDQHVLRPETIREICERSLLLMASSEGS